MNIPQISPSYWFILSFFIIFFSLMLLSIDFKHNSMNNKNIVIKKSSLKW